MTTSMANLKARHDPTIECQSPQLSGSTEILPSLLELKYAELKTDVTYICLICGSRDNNE